MKIGSNITVTDRRQTDRRQRAMCSGAPTMTAYNNNTVTSLLHIWRTLMNSVESSSRCKQIWQRTFSRQRVFDSIKTHM